MNMPRHMARKPIHLNCGETADGTGSDRSCMQWSSAPIWMIGIGGHYQGGKRRAKWEKRDRPRQYCSSKTTASCVKAFGRKLARKNRRFPISPLAIRRARHHIAASPENELALGIDVGRAAFEFTGKGRSPQGSSALLIPVGNGRFTRRPYLPSPPSRRYSPDRRAPERPPSLSPCPAPP